MKIKDLKEKQLTTLLTELFGLDGAKEIFKKHNIEMVTKETEKQGFLNFIKAFENVMATGKAMTEYKQATTFLDAQINSNEAMLATAEGFMKTMIGGMIESFKATKKGIEGSKKAEVIAEVTPLIEAHILNESDRRYLVKLLNNLSLDDKEKFIKSTDVIVTAIVERYTGQICGCDGTCGDECAYKSEQQEEPKEVKKFIELDTDDDGILDGLDDLDVDLDNNKKEETEPKKEIVEETKEIDTEVDADLDLDDLDLGDLDDLEEETKETPKKEVKQEAPKKKAEKIEDELDDFEDIDLDDLDLDLGSDTEIDPFM